MAISKETKMIGGLVAVTFLGTWLLARKSKVATHDKDVYTPGDQIRVWQGMPFTMRLPAGQWLSLNDELQITTQTQYGNSTSVQVLAIAAPSDYVVNAIFMRADDSRVQETFTVHARKPV